MSERELRRTQWVASGVEEVFRFFERPENLERLTPHELGFEILGPKPVAMSRGTLIDYRVSPFGVPMRWRTLIEDYDRPRSFTDLQVRGPYAYWRHTHLFEPERGGTRMTDIVRYRLPLGPLGALAAPLVRRELERIFDHRERAVADLFRSRGGSMHIVLAGGSGFIGARLARALLLKGCRVTVLSRGARPIAPGAELALWDGKSAGPWEEVLEGCDAVVNLCGAGVADRPWTAGRRRELVDSRLEPTRALVSALERRRRRPAALVNASAVGYYGDGGAADLPETAPRGEGFLADLCARWEAEARRAEALGVRTVLLRIGVVLGREGGALPRMLPPFRLGLGGRLGDGGQSMPWIHADDLVGLILDALENPSYAGPVNGVAPGAATNADFTRALGRALGRPALVPVPAFGLRLLLGEMSRILLDSQKAVPSAALCAGYRFAFPEVEGALRELAA